MNIKAAIGGGTRPRTYGVVIDQPRKERVTISKWGCGCTQDTRTPIVFVGRETGHGPVIFAEPDGATCTTTRTSPAHLEAC